jgi:16S rRNA (cytosine1402-N4)-methyltransferase
MRMSGAGQSAADLVATLPESELAELIRGLGEERFARRIARAINGARQRRPIQRTTELAEIVRAAIPQSEPGQDPATRTFQALRIAVNDELGELDRGLAAAEQLLMPGGRLAVVSFHSLEDRRVKEFLRRRSDLAPRASRHRPVGTETPPPSFTLLTRRAVKPSAAEIAHNPRARAARLRAAARTAAPPWPRNGERHVGRHSGQRA